MIVISTGIMMSTADSTQKKVDMLMSDRTVLKRKSTDHSETRIEEEGRERIKKGMKTEVRGQWSEVGRATEAGLPLDGSSFTEEKLFVQREDLFFMLFRRTGSWFWAKDQGRLFTALRVSHAFNLELRTCN